MCFMDLGNIVWSGPRADTDFELLTDAYLGSRA